MGVLATALCAAAALAGPAEAPRVGGAVPDFAATTIDGAALSLHEAVAAHRVVVVVFLSTVCPYANLFGPHLGLLAREYGPRGVLFIGVNSNQFETAEEMAESAASHGEAFPMIRDPEATIANRLGASCSPEAYVVDQQGRLRYHGWVQSKLRSPDLRRGLEAVLGGRPVRPARTKAFGCSLDRPRTVLASH